VIREGDGPDEDGLNKYMGRDGDGHRGRCLAIRNDGKQALIEGLTEHPGRKLLVQERSAGHWPWFVRFWDEDLPTMGWKRCGESSVQALRGGKLRFGMVMRGFELTPREILYEKYVPAPKRSWLDNLLAKMRRWFS